MATKAGTLSKSYKDMISSEKSLATENHAFFLYLAAKFDMMDSSKPKPINTGKSVPASSIKFLIAESELRTVTSGATNFDKNRTSKSAFRGP